MIPPSGFVPRTTGNVHQVSAEPNPDAEPAVRAIWRNLLRLGACLCVLGGAHGVVVADARWKSVLSGVVFVVGSIGVGATVWTYGLKFRAWYRIHRDRCVHCGYSTKGLLTAKCPECGRDPIPFSDAPA